MPASAPADCHDTPAAALGAVSLFLGLTAATGFVPRLTLLMVPLMVLGGGLAVAFGLMGVHYAGRGIGRRWIAVTGTVLGVLTLAYALVVVHALLPVLGV
ncbi:hypothetical protein [Streptomyces sp. AF1A]|jgi:hypothetical protein|uniref:hypothetical protein n=1 Tax=Streptomyces sp. AF1A TaxID=3394350 RepID=UPI0039BC9A76